MDGEENKYRKYPLNPDNQQIFDYLKNQISKMPMKEVKRKLRESDVIPFLAGRPERDTVVGDHDDMLNLEIAFYTAQSFEEFFNLI